ncbi:diguanylate cyclase [Thermosipho melanesiensis]|uniref:Response regulator receiver modulated diguanylate cyclase n=2 Tax=Thermosipho melanesiensis TaxID=46541 RepID=A6LJN4_THEM4|nr:diguanylate cyclase [Thermosipho melanesiensis]ABR30135.1 response regulator receiver modulated diguanylate cyclase [Thermosipho melanesiensis BI429]APT73332.1 diguanylate cyclase [Thermosipho melanesiensis]OOC38747.1 diguanylate cyclase [Thermosipho melanesiensis]OOC40525.1 diguanylate cyclase [Thermosipho melanesiensis]OOC40815.1 diguanylate cyclase [Thermosipho melanesiensis]
MSKKILVVDDSELWRRFLKYELEKMGNEVEVAVDGLDGINKFFSFLPDVVITDYLMPNMNGIHLTRFIRSYAEFENVGIVILTAGNETINKFWAKKSGANLYIKKTLDKKEIIEKLKGFLNENYHIEWSSEVLKIRKEPFGELVDILEENLRNELVISEIYSFLEYIHDERYLIECIYKLFKEFFEFKSLHTLIFNVESERIYSISDDERSFNRKEIEKTLELLLKKPVTPAKKIYNGNYVKNGETLEDFISVVIEYKNEEQAAFLIEGLKKERDFLETIVVIKKPLALVFKLLNEYNLSKSKTEFDELTKVYNRAFIMEKLKELLQLSLRQKIPLSVAMIDIDDFKKVNDTYGHLKGDEVLKKVAQIIRDNLRESDYVGRYGGEEFLVILPGISCNQAKKVLERILDKVRNTDWKSLGVNNVTFSAGLCCKPEKSMLGFIKRADKNLYIAKKRGKNQVYGGE